MNEKDLINNRLVADFVDPEGLFAEKLRKKISGEYSDDIVIKFGVDPTRPDIHLGHAVVFRFLRKMQDLGCKVIFLVGDFTAKIGDPTGKSKVRPEIEQEEIERNMNTYLEQVGKILSTDSKVFSWIRNSDWFVAVEDIIPGLNDKVTLSVKKAGINFDAQIPPNSFVGKAVLYMNTRMQSKMLNNEEIRSITLRGFLWTLRHITHQRLIARDMFKDRLETGEELFLHEMMYPVLQGIDSFVLSQIYGSCDLEIGGTDQTFNMLMGRDVMKINNTPPQAVISCNILKGLDGKEKMSKSLDNYISINEPASEIFGKVMSIPDSLLEEYLILCTDLSDSEVNDRMSKINSGSNPRDIKIDLAFEIVKMYCGENQALSAKEAFLNVFSKKEFPAEAQVVKVEQGQKLSDILVDNKIIESKSEFRRLVESGAVSVYPDQKIEDPNYTVEDSIKLKIGKKTFVVLEM